MTGTAKHSPGVNGKGLFNFLRPISTCAMETLSDHDVKIRNFDSSLNYKNAVSLKYNHEIFHIFPHTGIRNGQETYGLKIFEKQIPSLITEDLR